MTDQLRGWRALAEHYDRAVPTVRDWADNGCPHTKDGNVHVFLIEEVDAWLQTRSGVISSDSNLLDGASDDDRDALLQARIRKLQLESDALQRKKEEDNELTGRIADFEQATITTLNHVKQHMNDLFDELMELANITASEKEQLKAKMIDGFNDLADTSEFN